MLDLFSFVILNSNEVNCNSLLKLVAGLGCIQAGFKMVELI
jgi:hypothetical protein